MNDDEKKAYIESLPYEIPTHLNWNSIAQIYHPLMAGSIDGTDLVAHDKAIIRASKSNYKSNKKVTGDPRKTIMVRHLASHTTEKTLNETFQKFAELQKCRLIRDIISGYSKCYGFVEFKHERDTRRILRENKELVIDGNHVILDNECERTLPGWIPRRFGGGFGGKKESGQLRFGGIERPFRKPIPIGSKPMGSVKRDYGMASGSSNSGHYDRSNDRSKRSRR